MNPKYQIVAEALRDGILDGNPEISLMETAGEGGPYGMALLAGYRIWKEENEKLEDYLDHKVFAGAKSVTLKADEKDISGFAAFLEAYKKALPVEIAAIQWL